MTTTVTKLFIVLPMLLLSSRSDFGNTSENELFSKIYGSIGVVRYKNSPKNNRDLIIYNESGSIYAVISVNKNRAKFGTTIINYNDGGPDSDFLKKRFRFDPIAYVVEYGILLFDLKRREKDRLYIYVDQEKKNTKYILNDPRQLSVRSWPEHLLNKSREDILEIEFDEKKNPLVNKNNGREKVIKLTTTEGISWRILRFVGEWVEIQSVQGCYEAPKKQYKGWVRWTNGKRPLLHLFYDC